MTSKFYPKSLLKIALFIATLFSSATAIALLPPYYKTAKEITAILNDSEVAEKITSGRVIHSIIKTKSGYTLKAGSCTLKVKVNYLPPSQHLDLVGAAVFEIKTGDLNCQI
ncbi:MAG TPA: hypothetical protein VNK03_00175 [Gammaproteobacteria bacterium]|nr:hypothetical protein [Gammaproteobacteria bacterium]